MPDLDLPIRPDVWRIAEGLSYMISRQPPRNLDDFPPSVRVDIERLIAAGRFTPDGISGFFDNDTGTHDSKYERERSCLLAGAILSRSKSTEFLMKLTPDFNIDNYKHFVDENRPPAMA